MIKKYLHAYNYPLLAAIILLSFFGVIMVYSSSMVVAVSLYQGSSDLFFKRQLISLFIGFAALIVTMNIPYKIYKNGWVIFIILAGIFAFLFIVLLVGKVSNNAQSWLNIVANRGLQPSEFSKLAIIIYLSVVFSKKQKTINNFFKSFIGPIIVIVFTFILVFLQPDLGTGLIILAISAVLIMCSGTSFKNIFGLISFTLLLLMILVPLAIQFGIITSEQISRFRGAYQPFEYLKTDGYQLVNSYISIGMGGLNGLGLGESIQKYGYLPEPHTDFIMAIVSEELGIYGVSYVLILLLGIIVMGFRTAFKCKDAFGSLLSIGISSLIAIQAIVNLGGLVGLLPLTGVPLPLVSYGGSSLLMFMLSLGILLNVSLKVKLDELKQSSTNTKIA
ncbi:MAG: cell division protein FtsW [Bacillales bacterium]|jgi:cell division protein FtsW|nr:cell division protein FtsW [Bacillales bacterium]